TNEKLCAMPYIDFLLQVQSDLFSIGAALATPTYMDVELDETKIEKEIDDLQNGLPELHAFILPGGCEEAALSHVCRTVCRRAERNIIKLQENTRISNKIVIYINRLSDFFFVLAKKCNFLQQIEENTWNNHCR
ncbi:MAG: cob(I)yrinic acid a,c-diamide adenosyltransferase, partial [Prevotellaceae bacterium]|nr:cob(I)yrinic acid a,c-diamide adenosyltransferase [Prevotellaceae bacterium]